MFYISCWWSYLENMQLGLVLAGKVDGNQRQLVFQVDLPSPTPQTQLKDASFQQVTCPNDCYKLLTSARYWGPQDVSPLSCRWMSPRLPQQPQPLEISVQEALLLRKDGIFISPLLYLLPCLSRKDDSPSIAVRVLFWIMPSTLVFQSQDLTQPQDVQQQTHPRSNKKTLFCVGWIRWHFLWPSVMVSLWCSPSRMRPQNFGILMDHLSNHVTYEYIDIQCTCVLCIETYVCDQIYVSIQIHLQKYLGKGSHKLYQPKVSGSQFEGPVHCDWVSRELHDILSDLQAFHSVYLSNWNQT